MLWSYLLIVTLFVNFEHNFHKENETFSKKKIKTVQREKLEDGTVFVRIAVSYLWLVNN